MANEAGTSSLTTVVAAAIQNYHSSHGSFSAPTTFAGLTATDAYSTPTPTIEETDDEFDGSGSLFPSSGGVRLGVHTPYEFGGRIRAGNIGHALRAAGFVPTARAVYELDFTGTTGGTYDLTFNSQTASDVPWNSTAAEIQAELEGLSNVIPGEVVVQGTFPSFEVAWFKTVSGFTIDDANLTGSTPTGTIGASSTVYAHSFEPAASDPLFPWASWYHAVGVNDNFLKRLIQNCRSNRFDLTANRNSVARFVTAGMGSHEEVAGSPTINADTTGALLRTVEGAFSLLNSSGTVLTGSARNVTANVANEFPSTEDNFDIGTHEFGWMTWLAMLVTGSVDTQFNKDIFEEMYYGGASTAGSGYSFVEMIGSLNMRLDAAANISGSASKQSMLVSVPYLNARGGEFRSSGRNEIRLPITWRAFKQSGAPLVRFGLINTVASYTA